MSEFEDFIRSQGFNGGFQRGCNGQYKSDLLHFMEKAFMHQQTKIDELQKKINNVNEVLSKANIKDDRFSLEFALNEIEELLK